MTKSRAYRTVKIKNVRPELLGCQRESQRVTFGLDLSKEFIVAVLRWEAGDLERAWKIKNPLEIRDFVELAAMLVGRHDVRVALEPTGT